MTEDLAKCAKMFAPIVKKRDSMRDPFHSCAFFDDPDVRFIWHSTREFILRNPGCQNTFQIYSNLFSESDAGAQEFIWLYGTQPFTGKPFIIDELLSMLQIVNYDLDQHNMSPLQRNIDVAVSKLKTYHRQSLPKL